jgi:hypothetical protein
LDATRRVYSQPIFKQKLPLSHRQSLTPTLVAPSHVLSELLAEFSAGFRGPPKSRDEAGPYHAHRDGRRTMERNIDNRYVQLSRVVTMGSFSSVLQPSLGRNTRTRISMLGCTSGGRIAQSSRIAVWRRCSKSKASRRRIRIWPAWLASCEIAYKPWLPSRRRT